MIAILREAHQAVEQARARGRTSLDQDILDDLRERYDVAVAPCVVLTCVTSTLPETPLGCMTRQSMCMCWLRAVNR